MKANVFIVHDADTDRVWAVRYLAEGEKYGLHDRLVCGEEPLVEFYDTRYAHTDLGQFVSRYYVETLLRDPRDQTGLNLDGGVPSWFIHADAMKKVYAWLRAQKEIA